MPEVVWSSEKIGAGDHHRSGLKQTEIAGIAGDQQAALFGQLCIQPGDAKNTYGTGCFLLQNIGDTVRPLGEAADHYAHLQPGQEAGICARRQHLHRRRGRAVAARQPAADSHILPRSKRLAATVEDSDGVVLVPAFVGLGAPYWDPYASGLLIGLRRGTKPGHIARAAMESIAFQVADVIEAMDADTKVPFRELRVDGGAAVDDLLMQFQADLLGVPVVRPAVSETTALGAAYLAGLAVGFWESPEEIRKLRAADTRFEPHAGQKKIAAGRDTLEESGRAVKDTGMKEMSKMNRPAMLARVARTFHSLGHRHHRRRSHRRGRRRRRGHPRL